MGYMNYENKMHYNSYYNNYLNDLDWKSNEEYCPNCGKRKMMYGFQNPSQAGFDWGREKYAQNNDCDTSAHKPNELQHNETSYNINNNPPINHDSYKEQKQHFSKEPQAPLMRQPHCNEYHTPHCNEHHAPCCPQKDGCKIEPCVPCAVSVPMNINAQAKIEDVTTRCCGAPFFANECHLPKNLCDGCKITVMQNICVCIPIEIDAKACAGDASITCCIPDKSK